MLSVKEKLIKELHTEMDLLINEINESKKEIGNLNNEKKELQLTIDDYINKNTINEEIIETKNNEINEIKNEMKNELILKTAECDGLGSELLILQQELIKANARAESLKLTLRDMSTYRRGISPVTAAGLRGLAKDAVHYDEKGYDNDTENYV